MKINFLISILSAILLGYLCATYIFNEYRDTDLVFQENETIYFLQYGVYTNPELPDIPVSKYLKVEEEGKYYVYVGMTTSQKNAKKVQDLYQKKGIELYVKQDYVTNPEFITELSQYDILLDSTKTEDEVNSVLSTVLASYEEAVLKK
ncbi:MAG: hypothetical protein PUB18_02090 [bacterium]|nr:hypothetical protein [bacterium]